MFSLATRPATQSEIDELNRRGRLANRLDGWLIGCTLVLTLVAAFVTALVVALLVWFGQVAEPGASFTTTFLGHMKWCVLILGATAAVLLLGNFLSNCCRRRYRHPLDIEDLSATAIAAASIFIYYNPEQPMLLLLVEPHRVLVLAPYNLLPQPFTTTVPGTYKRTKLESDITLHESLAGDEIPVTSVELPLEFHPGMTCLAGKCVNLEDLPHSLRHTFASQPQ